MKSRTYCRPGTSESSSASRGRGVSPEVGEAARPAVTAGAGGSGSGPDSVATARRNASSSRVVSISALCGSRIVTPPRTASRRGSERTSMSPRPDTGISSSSTAISRRIHDQCRSPGERQGGVAHAAFSQVCGVPSAPLLRRLLAEVLAVPGQDEQVPIPAPYRRILGDGRPREVMRLAAGEAHHMNGQQLPLQSRAPERRVEPSVAVEQAAQRGGGPGDGGRQFPPVREPCPEAVRIRTVQHQLNRQVDGACLPFFEPDGPFGAQGLAGRAQPCGRGLPGSEEPGTRGPVRNLLRQGGGFHTVCGRSVSEDIDGRQPEAVLRVGRRGIRRWNPWRESPPRCANRLGSARATRYDRPPRRSSTGPTTVRCAAPPTAPYSWRREWGLRRSAE